MSTPRAVRMRSPTFWLVRLGPKSDFNGKSPPLFDDYEVTSIKSFFVMVSEHTGRETRIPLPLVTIIYTCSIT